MRGDSPYLGSKGGKWLLTLIKDMSFHAKFRSWYPDIARLTGTLLVEESSEDGKDFECLRELVGGAFVRTSMVRFESPDTSTVKMIAFAPSRSAFRIRGGV